MNEDAKRVRHLVRVPQSLMGGAATYGEKIAAGEFGARMRAALTAATKELVSCQEEEDNAGARMEPSTMEMMEGPAIALQKRFMLRRMAKFKAAYRFVELTSLLLHEALGQSPISYDDVGTGLEAEELATVASVNNFGRKVRRGGGR